MFRKFGHFSLQFSGDLLVDLPVDLSVSKSFFDFLDLLFDLRQFRFYILIVHCVFLNDVMVNFQEPVAKHWYVRLVSLENG
ncbi:MAG: hypothetical protein ACOYXT_06500 [Bacteroidota bacterium]